MFSRATRECGGERQRSGSPGEPGRARPVRGAIGEVDKSGSEALGAPTPRCRHWRTQHPVADTMAGCRTDCLRRRRIVSTAAGEPDFPRRRTGSRGQDCPASRRSLRPTPERGADPSDSPHAVHELGASWRPRNAMTLSGAFCLRLVAQPASLGSPGEPADSARYGATLIHPTRGSWCQGLPGAADGRPIANNWSSLRRKICPSEMAGDPISRWPMSLRAITSGVRPDFMTMVSPVSLTK